MPQTAQIIPYYSQPFVQSVINDNTFYSEDTAKAGVGVEKPYSTLVVTGADKGIDNKLIKLSDYTTKVELFGKSNFTKYGQPSLQADVLLQNGQTNVWFMRVLPDNARYANLIVLAKYRIGNILDANNQPTGKKRLEIKFDTAYATPPTLADGAIDEYAINTYAMSLKNDTVDPLTGYKTLPLFYVRSTGRGKYGNRYSIRLSRDYDFEYDYGVKTYGFGVIENDVVTSAKNYFVGSMINTVKYSYSTLIDDVLNKYPTGTTPIMIKTFEDSIAALYNVYANVVNDNANYIKTSNASADDKAELAVAKAITIDVFDPIFGLKLNTRNNELIPYYQNYTIQGSGYVVPDKSTASVKPINVSSWNTAFVGAKLLLTADPNHDNKRYSYMVTAIDTNGNITYDDGVEEAIDASEYNGKNLAINVGILLDGGFDGDFESISVDGLTHVPNNSELKILLSREYVKAFRGKKDRYILSPARVNLDYIFDANYNMTVVDSTLAIDSTIRSLYNGSTILTDEDYRTLSIMASDSVFIEAEEINVKKAMYDLNVFRNKNGIPLAKDEGAGCELKLDTGLVGLKSINVNSELHDIILAMEQFDGRNTSIDFGFYEIIDPVSGRKIKVTATYFLAESLIPHIVKHGPNKPFVNSYAQITNIVKNSFMPELDLIDWDVKEELYKNRINYYLTLDEGNTVQRAVQNTCQKDASALLEETNVRVLNILKKGLEKSNRAYLYEWNDPVVRKGYTDSQMDIYRPWIGSWVQDISIHFEANEYEQSHMIMHCYVSVAFRDIAKRIVLEIDINRPDYNQGGGK
jgi:hypothetical protein